MGRYGDDSGDGGLIFIIFFLWILIGTCSSCDNSKKALDKSTSIEQQLNNVEKKIDNLTKKINEKKVP